jgi:hypothetical protein
MATLTRERILLQPADPRPGDRLLVDFVIAVEAGEIPKPDVLRELAARLRRVIEGEASDKALDVIHPRGRRRAITDAAAGEVSGIAAQVEFCMRERGETKESAAQMLSVELGKSRSAILRAYAAAPADPGSFTETLVKVMSGASVFKPLPPAGARKRRPSRTLKK